jgi:hypothetical protein
MNVDGEEKRLTNVYNTSNDGSRDAYIEQFPYDARDQNWYQEPKQTEIKSWVGPYFPVGDDVIYPVITLVQPLFKKEVFAGVLGVDYNLKDLNMQLQEAFPTKEVITFVVNREGEFLLASNIDVSVSEGSHSVSGKPVSHV